METETTRVPKSKVNQSLNTWVATALKFRWPGTIMLLFSAGLILNREFNVSGMLVWPIVLAIGIAVKFLDNQKEQ